MKQAQLSAFLLLLGIGCWTACRQVSVCDTHLDCASQTSMAGEGGAFAPTPADSSAPGLAGETGDAEAAAGGTNATAGGAAGEPVGGQPPVGPRCASGNDDCDESTLTVCETPTNFSFRHCGACNLRCDGTCSRGKCKQAQSLLDSGVHGFAANASAAFALVAAPNNTEDLLRFEVNSGESSVLTEGLESGAELLLGSNRLYAYYSHRVVSVGLDGMAAITEAFWPESFGVTSAGVYYTSYVTDPDTDEDTWTLWFRPQASSAFTAISEGKECDILGSSSQALLVRRETDGNAEILLAHGADLTLLGDSPGDATAALPAGTGAAFLLSNDAVPSGYELVWLKEDEPATHIALEAKPDGLGLELSHALVPAPDGVALQLDDRGNTFVRIFSRTGAEAVPLGIPNYSTLAYVDERYLWYSWFGATDLSQQFFRARQFEIKDLVPVE